MFIPWKGSFGEMNMEFDYWTGKAREEISQFEASESPELISSDVSASPDNEIGTEDVNSDAVIKEEICTDQYKDKNDEIKEDRKGKRICKAVFLGVPFGIPIFIAMLVLISACVAAVSVLFGLLVMSCALLVLGGLGFVVLGIANVHLALAPSFLLIGSGVLAIGLGIFLTFLTRLVFKYVLLGIFKVYVLPVRFIRLFFVQKSVLSDDTRNDTTEEPKIPGFFKPLSISAAVLVAVGVVLMLTTFFVFYSEDLPSKIDTRHKVLVKGKVLGIDISSSYFNVSIEKGDDFYILFEDTYSPGKDVVIEDGILKITGKYCDDIEIFGFDISPISKLYDPCGGNVTIVVPSDRYMQLIYADIGCGSFNMKDISCARLVSQVGIGSIRLDDVDVAYDKFLECKLGPVYNNVD